MKSMIFEQLAKVSDGKIQIGGKGGLQNVTKASADSVLTGILNNIYLWAGIICILIIIIAGYYYTTSSGDSSQTTRAKNAILAAIIGLIVITMAFTLTDFVIGRI